MHVVRGKKIEVLFSPEEIAARNEELARERAAAVKRYLQRMGVEEPELRVVSMGEQAARWELFSRDGDVLRHRACNGSWQWEAGARE